MEEMSDEQLLCLEGVTSEYAAPLLYAMQSALKSQEIKKKNKKISLLFMDEDNLSAKFLDVLGVVEGTGIGTGSGTGSDADGASGDAPPPAEEARGDGILHPPTNWKMKLELEAAFRVLFALHGGDEDVQDLLSPDDCCKTKCVIL